KRGEPYAQIRLEDLTGGVGIVVFPSVFDKAVDLLRPDQVIMVKGRADLRGRELQLVALEITSPDVSPPSGQGRGGSADPPPSPRQEGLPPHPPLADTPTRTPNTGLL